MNIRWLTSSFCHSNIREITLKFCKMQDQMKQVEWWHSKRKHTLELSVVVAELLEADLPNRTLVCFWAWSQQLGWRAEAGSGLKVTDYVTVLHEQLLFTHHLPRHCPESQHLPADRTEKNPKTLNKIFKESSDSGSQVGTPEFSLF